MDEGATGIHILSCPRYGLWNYECYSRRWTSGSSQVREGMQLVTSRLTGHSQLGLGVLLLNINNFPECQFQTGHSVTRIDQDKNKTTPQPCLDTEKI